MDNEEWRSLPGDPNCQVSDCGRVKAIRRGKGWVMLKPCSDSYGYQHVFVTFNGKRCSTPVHRLVMLAFVGELPKGYHTHHIDANKANNRLDNLRYVTPAENAAATIPFRLQKSIEQNRIRRQRNDEYIARLNAAKEAGLMSAELAMERFTQLHIHPLVVTEVPGLPNTFDTTLAKPLSEQAIELLLLCNLYPCPKDLISNDYRITWYPDGIEE